MEGSWPLRLKRQSFTLKLRRQSGAVSDGTSQSPKSFWEIQKQNTHPMFILLSSLTGACSQTTDAKEGRQLCRTEGQKHGTQKKEKERKNTNGFQTTFLQKEACRRWRLTENDGTLPGFDFFFPFRLISVPKLHNRVLGLFFFGVFLWAVWGQR